MTFGHKKLDVYQASLQYVSWVYKLADRLTGIHRHARDQLLRASQSILLNIAEGNGKLGDVERRRFWGIARGSALECAAIQDVLLVGKAITEQENVEAEGLLVRIVSMLTKMTKKTWSIKEGESYYGDRDIDHDHNHDHDHGK